MQLRLLGGQRVEGSFPFLEFTLRLLQFGEHIAVLGPLLPRLRLALLELALRIFENSGRILLLLVCVRDHLLDLLALLVNLGQLLFELFPLKSFKLVLELLDLPIVLAHMILDEGQFLHLILLFVDLCLNQFGRQLRNIFVQDRLVQGEELSFEFPELLLAGAACLYRVCNQLLELL